MTEQEKDQQHQRTSLIREEKHESPPVKEVARVTSGKVKRKRVSLKKRFEDAFMDGMTFEEAMTKAISDAVIPAIKRAMLNSIQDTIDTIFGVSRDRRDGYYRSSTRYDQVRNSNSRPSSTTRPRRSVDEIILETRSDADYVIDGLNDLMKQYNMVSVADLYDLAGLPSQFTDNKYGWTSLTNMTIRNVPEGYLLVMPRPIVLED